MSFCHFSEDKIVTIKPHTPGKSDTILKKKLIEELTRFMSAQSSENKTLLLYFSGHYYKQKGFQLGNNENFITVKEFQDHLFGSEVKSEHSIRLIVFLDCCTAPKISPEKFQCSKDVILVQMNASRPNEQTLGDEIEGSIFQRLFTQALTGRALSTKCTSITQNNHECQNCFIDSEFVSINNLHDFIDKHYTAYKLSSRPTIYIPNVVIKNDLIIGYAINFCVDLEFHFKWKEHTVVQKISPRMFYDIEELRTVLFDKFCHFVGKYIHEYFNV